MSSPITCHVLDTTTGRPAGNIGVTLTLWTPTDIEGKESSFEATTDADGRIKAWEPIIADKTVPETIKKVAELGHDSCVWDLKFQTEAYFGRGKTFYPEVEIRFRVAASATGDFEHYHVPLLLGPYSYTTYRGS